MKISIITATYNSSKTIAETIASIYSQKYPDIEHIVIDGKSKDNTLQIIESIPNRVSKIVSEPDKGIYDAMNKGIDLVTGDIVGILNSDDFYSSDDIISDVAGIFQKTNCDAIYGDLEYVNEINTNKVVRYWKSKEYKKGLFKTGWHPAHPTFFVKKEIYEKYGNFNLKYRIAADYEIMLRFIEKNKIKTVYLPKIMVKMRTGGASNKSLKNIIQANKECYSAWKDNGLSISPLIFLMKPFSKIFQFVR
ncbi:glycosyl transferase [Capnocytophaga canis]|uniref:glycosyltransferase family 2 protein n=1 Tax=Capnocytophaga canis TaxID=1848903 RepID=UPI001ACDA1E9|nr:glycosyltransferase family 2 protein [Capnocytophaga canis]GIM61833.1 glycosyl transferase [Capnocytophaga canis]